MGDTTNKPIIAFLSTYPPRKCGIATFTYDTATAVNNLPSYLFKSKIIAINDHKQTYNYSKDVLFQIDNAEIKDYVKAARIINENENIKAVSIQHEFKLYGFDYGDYGDNLLSFLETVKKPILRQCIPCYLLHPTIEKRLFNNWLKIQTIWLSCLS